MWPQKQKDIMKLAPQLMARFIRVHQTGAFVEEIPADVAEWTAKVWAEGAAVNPLQEPMEQWYTRCTCQPKDPDTDSNTVDLTSPSGEC